ARNVDPEGHQRPKVVTPAAQRQAVAHACTAHGVSERRACEVMGVDRSSMRYSTRRAGDAAVRLRIRELAAQRRRFGYRRLHLLLTREGCRMNQKRFRRLYREEKLQVRKRGGRKRALGMRAPIALPGGPMSAGHSISCPTASPTAGACASWQPSTTSR